MSQKYRGPKHLIPTNDAVLCAEKFFGAQPSLVTSWNFEDSSWSTLKKPFRKKEIVEHLSGECIHAVYASKYTSYKVFDIDIADREKAKEAANAILQQLKIEDHQYLIVKSRTKGFHIYIKCVFKDQPISSNLADTILFECLGKPAGVDILPTRTQPIRGFASPWFPILDRNTLEPLKEEPLRPEEFFVAFDALVPVEFFGLSADCRSYAKTLKTVIPQKNLPKSITEGLELLENGLIASGTRNYSQYLMLQTLWLQRVEKEVAIDRVIDTILMRHNGYSLTAQQTPYIVEKEVVYAAEYIWSTYVRKVSRKISRSSETFLGGLGEETIRNAARDAAGSVVTFKFLLQLYAYFNGKGVRKTNVHRDRLKEWASSSYLKRLDDLLERKIIFRHERKGYSSNNFAKNIQLLTHTPEPPENWIFDGEDPATPMEALFTLGQKQFNKILRENGFSKRSIQSAWETVTVS